MTPNIVLLLFRFLISESTGEYQIRFLSVGGVFVPVLFVALALRAALQTFGYFILGRSI